jgi:hypothetical protein
MGREGGKSAIPAFFFAILGLDAGTDALRNFRGAVRTLSDTDQLPDYRVRLDETDLVTFSRR